MVKVGSPCGARRWQMVAAGPLLAQVGCGRPSAPLPVSDPGRLSAHTDTSFGTPPGYGCAADQAEEQRRQQDGLPYIDDSPSSSPHLGGKGRGSRDALASGALESARAVSPGQRAASLSHRLPGAQPLCSGAGTSGDGAATGGCRVAKTPFSSSIRGTGTAWGCRELSAQRGGGGQLMLGPVGAAPPPPAALVLSRRDPHKCTCSLLPERVLTTPPI